MKLKKWVFIGFIFIILWQVSLVGAVSVEPIVIKLKAKPGEKVSFSVRFRSTENYSELVKFTAAQPLQKPDGGLEFKPVKPEEFPEASWLTLSTSQVNVPKGGEAELTGFVKVPFKEKGFHTIAIMGEQPSKESGAFLVSIIYAIRLDITIDAPTPRVTAEVSDFELVKGEKGEPSLQFKARNSSIVRMPANAYVAIRYKNTKKLFEKVELRPTAFWSNNLEPVMLPGTMLNFTGTPKEALLPGDYDLQLFFRYASSGQIIRTTSVQVKDKYFVYPTQKIRLIRVSPDDISLSGKPGTTAMKGIKLENKSDKTIKVVLKPVDVSIDYPHSALKNTNIELKNGKEYTLEPGRTAVAIVVIKYPKSAKVQGNYGVIKVTAYNSEGGKIEDSEVSVEALVIGKYSNSAEVTNLSATKDGEGILLSTVVRNSGNVRIVPEVELLVKSSDGKSIGSAKLSGQEEKTVILPMKNMTFAGNFNENLPAGEYKAEIRIIQGNDEIGRTTKEFTIK